MNRSTIYIPSCMAVTALLFVSSADHARAACDPPRDVSSCIQVPNERFAQPNAVLPEPPFLVTYPDTPNKLVLTNPKSKTPKSAPGNALVPAAHLTNSAIANRRQPFVVRFPDGRSLVASPMPGP